MNILQMKYFVETAKCLSFSKAADKLYITQPALSRQISAMEKELNVILFFRNNRSVKPTPAAVVLLKEFQEILDKYNMAVANAQNSFAGINGEVNIGVLDGTYVGDLIPDVLKYFNDHYPNVKINLRTHSFNGLLQRLYANELDLIITLFFDIAEREKINYRIIEKSQDWVVVHKDHPLANEKYVKLSDFRDDTFMMVSTEDSENSPFLILDAWKKQGVTPKVKFASSIQEEMLWVEAGVGVCILDSRNTLRYNSNVRFLDVEPLSDPSLTIAWNSDNTNPMRELFIDILLGGDHKS